MSCRPSGTLGHLGSFRLWGLPAWGSLTTHFCDFGQASLSPSFFLPYKEPYAQFCLTLCGPMDCSLPGSSVHGIFQVRVLEWGAISFSKESS